MVSVGEKAGKKVIVANGGGYDVDTPGMANYPEEVLAETRGIKRPDSNDSR